jgi:hypothetical protein
MSESYERSPERSTNVLLTTTTVRNTKAKGDHSNLSSTSLSDKALEASVVVGTDPAELRAQVEAELPEGWRTVSYERRVALIHHAGEIVAHRKAIRELLP